MFVVLDMLPVGVFILDRDFRIVFINRKMETYFGLDRDQVVGRLKQDVLSEHIKHKIEQPKAFVHRLVTAYRSNAFPDRFTIRVLADERHQRLERWLEHRSEPIRTGPYEGGRCEVYTDMSHQVEAERDQDFLYNQIMQLQEREKTRIAKDLHDGLSQAAVAIKLMLESIINTIGHDEPNHDIARRLKEVVHLADTMSDEIRTIAFDLMPAMLDPLGLPETLAWMRDHFAELYKIEIELACHGLKGRRLPAELEVPLYRIFQESLNNVFKHAHAEHVRLKLVYNHPNVLAIIEDDGQGFDPVTALTGIGIRSMQQRVEKIGGTFTLKTGPGAGTTIRVEIPIGKERRL